jgi:excisionase family DNA binding protein
VTGRLLTTREVAQQLGVTAETVLRWIETRGLPARRLTSRAIRYSQTDLDGWLDERATPGREAPTPPSDAAHGRLTSPVPTLPPRHDAASTEED